MPRFWGFQRSDHAQSRRDRAHSGEGGRSREGAEARAAFERAKASGDVDQAEALAREMDDLDAVGWVEAGALRDEVPAWLDLQAPR